MSAGAGRKHRSKGVAGKARTQAQEDPRKGEGAKAPGSHRALRGGRAEASNIVDIPAAFRRTLPVADELGNPNILPLTGVVSDGSPADMEVSPAALLTPPAQMNAYRRPSLKNVGRDDQGQVVRHHYSAEVEARITIWMAGGADENFICAMLNMRPGTLKQLYHHVLAHGKTAADMNVVSAAYRDALQPGAHAAQKFWLKARAGWKDGETAGDAGSFLNIHIHS